MYCGHDYDLYCHVGAVLTCVVFYHEYSIIVKMGMAMGSFFPEFFVDKLSVILYRLLHKWKPLKQ